MEELCISANGKKVIYDPINSHTATHFNDAPNLRNITIKLISNTRLSENIVAKDIDMGEIIGNSDVVDVDDTDEIIYAIRKNREDQGYVPFTKSRTSQPTSYISIHLVKLDSLTYKLSSVWFGNYDSPPFPQMENATDDSIHYWSKHAFVWGNQEIISGSETS